MKAGEAQRPEAPPEAYEGEHFVFIVGSPRSGTTITAETLSRHPDIAYLYEPYYLWKQGTDNSEDDELKASDCDDASVSLIRRYCHHFWRRSGVSFIVEQSPEESLMVPLLQRILPRARFIHMIRDGYDCIRSIGVEWQRRAELVQSRNPLAIANKVLATLGRQPSWRFRYLQVAFELGESGILRPWRWANKSKWKGAPGWGVRIPGWETILSENGSLTLNAMQWSYTVRSVLDALAEQPAGTQQEQRYEQLVTEPEPTLAMLQEWIGVRPEPGLGAEIHADSIGRGRCGISDEDLATITPRISLVMNRLGYELIE